MSTGGFLERIDRLGKPRSGQYVVEVDERSGILLEAEVERLDRVSVRHDPSIPWETKRRDLTDDSTPAEEARKDSNGYDVPERAFKQENSTESLACGPVDRGITHSPQCTELAPGIPEEPASSKGRDLGELTREFPL